MSDDAFAALARQLHAAHQQGQRFTSLTLGGQPLSLADAYAVQRDYVDLLSREPGSEIVGYKIGLTSPAMQQMCGIAHPVFGPILRRRVLDAARPITLNAYGRLGIEFEVAVRIGRDVPVDPAAVTPQQAASYADAVAVALELVDDRNADYAQLDAASLVADNAWNAGIVLGPWQTVPADLGGRSASLSLNGKLHAQGRVGQGSDHPLASLAWLVDALAQQQRALRAGDIVMTGSIVRTQFPTEAQTWRYAVEGLGEVEARVIDHPGDPRP